MPMKPPLPGGRAEVYVRSQSTKSEDVLMLSATAMRRLEALGNISKQGKCLNGLFRLLENRVLWYEAYANIYANKGAITPGVDEVTLDGFSEKRVASIITRLKSGTYRFQPTRRVYIPKKSGKKRPLGISSGDDKLVQEVVRMILERIYEPIFKDTSHGFRPGHSPHTALIQISDQWQSIKWVVDMDIRDYFTTINHDLLMGFLAKKIDDSRFLRLIRGKKRKKNLNYNRYCGKIERLRKKWDLLKGKEGKEQERQVIREEIRRVDRLRKQLPSGDPFDEGYKRLFYCRFADDFAIGIIGSFADAENIRQQVATFVQETLNLTIAEEKSHICHSKKGMIFVGYEVRTFSGDRVVKVRRGNRHTAFKAVSERIQLHIPKENLQKFCTTKGYGNYETTKAIHKKEWTQSSEAEIILAYNGELRGLANYYALAFSVKTVLHKLAQVWQVSLFKTLANKHKTSVNKIAKQLKTDDGYALTVPGEKKTRVIRVFRLKDLRPPLPSNPGIDKQSNVYIWTLSRSEVIKRLNSDQCEYCETRQGPFEIHHIRKL